MSEASVAAKGRRTYLRPVGVWERVLARVAFRSPEIRDNIEGRLPALLCEAGFTQVVELGRRATIFGSLWYYRAARRAGADH